MADEAPQSDNVSKKTEKTPDEKYETESKQIVEQSGEKNPLNGYRSSTYHFTMAALDGSNLTDPESYRNSQLKFVILRSGGKGFTGLSPQTKLSDTQLTDSKKLDDSGENYDKYAKVVNKASSDAALSNNQELTAGFNKESPGRFDMFIENVEIDSILTFSEEGNTSLPTQIKFEVIEPYSINGFIEALHISAVAAGYPSYLQASFLLKMEFWGYPDVEDFPEPELINNTERYYVFGLTGIDVDITEKGTRYKCTAVPYNERAFGEPNVVKKPIKMAGDTVRSILNNFITNINAQVATSDEAGKEGSTKLKHNIYDISFPVWDEKLGFINGPASKIADAKFTEVLKDNKLYAMIDPAAPGSPNAYKVNGAVQPTPAQQARQPESVKYNPKESTIQFAEGMNINDAITSVIRDSEYVRDILKNIGKRPNNPDQYGMLDYFLIKMEVENLDIIDEVSQKPFQKYTYVVTPYKIHISRIPSYGQNIIKEEDLKKISLREYNYIYTGQNVDVLNFKLNFNTLFFEAVPAAMGNKDQPQPKNAAAPDNSSEVKIKSDDSLKTADQINARSNARLKRQQVPTTPVKPTVTPLQSYGGNASQPLSDPYSTLARGMHDAVINSKASMLTGEMEILGDPFYLVTGGIGNYKSKPDTSKRGKTNKGEADHNYGEVLITINFRNPIDINSFENGGMMQFDANRVPFSGVYRVLKVNSNFRDGVFKQKLDILRLPGQVIDSNLRATDPADNFATSPNPSSQVIPDESRAQSPEERMDSETAMDQLNRGLPSPGLPGELSNFTNAEGGLGGSTPSLLNQTYGLISRSGNIMPETSIIGQALPSSPNDVSSNIRLQSSGLIGLSQESLAPAATLGSAANILTGNMSAERLIGSLGGTVVGSAIKSALNISNQGSGIGKGASLSITPISTFPGGLTSLDIKQGANINPTSLPTGSLSNISGVAKDLGTNALAAVQGIGNNLSGLVGGIGNKITQLTASPMDPQGIAAKVGLDPSRLSGLTGAGLQSKLQNQVTDIVKNTPSNVNLNQAASAGLVLDYLPASKMKNIPATPEFATAPIPQADVGYASSVVKKGGMTALENLYGVNSPSKLSSNLVPQELISAAQASPSGASSNPYSNLTGSVNSVDINSMKDKLNSAKSMLSGYSGQSPLDKLVNRINNG